MLNAYNLLKFVHVLSVIVWIGGITTLSVLVWRLRNERNREVVSIVLNQASFYAQRFVGSTSGLVLLTGLAMVGVAKIPFSTLWVMWGLGGVLVHFVFGAMILRKRMMALGQLYGSSTADEGSLAAASSRLWHAQLLYLLILASVVGAMVLKPTL
jgi:uncharacterized membrane protein